MMSFSPGSDGPSSRPATAHSRLPSRVARARLRVDLEVDLVQMYHQTQQIIFSGPSDRSKIEADSQRLDVLGRGTPDQAAAPA